MYPKPGNKEKSCVASLLALLVLSQSVFAANELRSAGGTWIRNLTPHAYADIFLEGDVYTGGFTLLPREADVGKEAELFLVVKAGKHWYMHDGNGYVPWTEGRLDMLQPMLRKRLGSREILPMLGEQSLFAGNYAVYGGYRTDGGALVYDPVPFRFTVQGGDSDGLLRFRSEAAMEAYLKSAMDSGSKQEQLQSGLPVTAFDSASAARRAAPRPICRSKAWTKLIPSSWSTIRCSCWQVAKLVPASMSTVWIRPAPPALACLRSRWTMRHSPMACTSWMTLTAAAAVL